MLCTEMCIRYRATISRTLPFIYIQLHTTYRKPLTCFSHFRDGFDKEKYGNGKLYHRCAIIVKNRILQWFKNLNGIVQNRYHSSYYQNCKHFSLKIVIKGHNMQGLYISISNYSAAVICMVTNVQMRHTFLMPPTYIS